MHKNSRWNDRFPPAVPTFSLSSFIFRVLKSVRQNPESDLHHEFLDKRKTRSDSGSLRLIVARLYETTVCLVRVQLRNPLPQLLHATVHRGSHIPSENNPAVKHHTEVNHSHSQIIQISIQSLHAFRIPFVHFREKLLQIAVRPV